MNPIIAGANIYSYASLIHKGFTKYRPHLTALFICALLTVILFFVFYKIHSSKRSEENRIDILEDNVIKYLTDNKVFNNSCGYLRYNKAPLIEGFAKVKVGSHTYKVHEDLANHEEAAIVMDRLNKVAKTLIDHVHTKYVIDKKALERIAPSFREIVYKGANALKKNFKTANMEENIPERSGGDTSYVIDKGDVFAMCLRDPKNNNQLDNNFNSLTFVLIHELSHLFTHTFGHDKLFWNNFRFLLQEAVEINLYHPIDYKKYGSPYCGIVISYCPLYDYKLEDYRAI